MKRLVVVLVLMSFVLSESGLSFARSPSSTALDKANDSATFKRDDVKPGAKSDAEKMKTEKETAVKEKAEKEKATQEKAIKEKGKAAQEKIKLNPDDVKKQ